MHPSSSIFEKIGWEASVVKANTFYVHTFITSQLDVTPEVLKCLETMMFYSSLGGYDITIIDHE